MWKKTLTFCCFGSPDARLSEELLRKTSPERTIAMAPIFLEEVGPSQTTDELFFYQTKPMISVIAATGLLYLRVRSFASNAAYNQMRKHCYVDVIGHCWIFCFCKSETFLLEKTNYRYRNTCKIRLIVLMPRVDMSLLRKGKGNYTVLTWG